MKRLNKLNSGEEQKAGEHLSEQKSELVVQTAEELLRHDAASVEVPRRVAERLRDSIANSPNSRPAWWRRLLGGSAS